MSLYNSMKKEILKNYVTNSVKKINDICRNTATSEQAMSS